MAITGSIPMLSSRNRSVVRFINSAGQHVGLGVRIQNDIWTADHVVDSATHITTGPDAVVCLSTSTTVKRLQAQDVAIFSLSKGSLADLKLKSAAVSRLRNLSHVTIPGYEEEHWFTSAGRIGGVVNKSLQQFEHYCSTQPGWSGAPLMVGGKVVGLHLRALTNTETNIGTAVADIHDCLYPDEAKRQGRGRTETDYSDMYNDLFDKLGDSRKFFQEQDDFHVFRQKDLTRDDLRGLNRQQLSEYMDDANDPDTGNHYNQHLIKNYIDDYNQGYEKKTHDTKIQISDIKESPTRNAVIAKGGGINVKKKSV